MSKSTNKDNNSLILSDEQSNFIKKALEGNNILVDACIGSGKTTAIQRLCDEMADKKILYLTYNKLLKLDAKSKIKSKNVMVTNYHGFATWVLIKNNKQFGYEDSIQQFLEAEPAIPSYDVLMIDEYQDIETELADMLEYIKKKNPGIQIIAVGDMEQKIYDKTSLNVKEFITKYLDKYIEIEFTTCFRLSNKIADMLGRVWNKKIVGVNDDCVVETMTIDTVIQFLSDKNPKDILCLGSRTGEMTKLLNRLEDEYPQTFNKKSIYASIRTSGGGSTEPNSKAAVFTTFDSCKGMEKSICIVFDWTFSYWNTRLIKPEQSYKILRNIFCVAASRGKDYIIFVDTNEALLSEEVLCNSGEKQKYADYYSIDDMFDFKYREDIDAAYELLAVNKIDVPLKHTNALDIRDKDELIDLLPCISVYQKASYFDDYDIEEDINQFLKIHKDLEFLYDENAKKMSLEEKILFLISLQTGHARYRTQVSLPLLTNDEKKKLNKRLSTRLEKDCTVQVPSEIDFCNKKGDLLFQAIGKSNILKDSIVYKVDYSYSVSKVHCLVCACYMKALGLEKGILWNTYDNTVYEITIPDMKKFMDAVTVAITKGRVKKYYD